MWYTLNNFFGKTDTLTASGGNAYLWSTSATTAKIGISPENTTEYWVTVSNNGCARKDSVNVTVNSLPLADAGINKAICIGNSTTLTATGGVAYSWSTNETTATISVSPTVTTVYTVIVENSTNCTATANVTVTVNPLPHADAGFNASISLGDTATLTASGGIHYHWNTNDTSAVIHVHPTTATIYYVTVTDANGCSATNDATVLVGNSIPYPETYWHKNDSILFTTSGISKVGIGTDNPIKKLSVGGSGFFQDSLFIGKSLKIDSLSGIGYKIDSLSTKSYKMVFADENGNLVVPNYPWGGDNPPAFDCSSGTYPWKLGGNKITDNYTDFIGTCNNWPFLMYTYGTEKMRITPGGFVGIATKSPKASLDVNGQIYIHDANSAAVINFPSSGNSPNLYFRCTDDPIHFVSGSNKMVILGNNGYVGIGIDDPQYRLDVCGIIHSTEWIVENITGCDYKFNSDYIRMSWNEKMDYVIKNGHLPEIDAASFMEKNGLMLGKNFSGLLSNVEDNTLDIIDLSKANKNQKEQIDKLKAENYFLKMKLKELELRIQKIENK